MMSALIYGDWGLGIGDWGLGPIPNPQVQRLNDLYIYILLNNYLLRTKKLIKKSYLDYSIMYYIIQIIWKRRKKVLKK